MDKTTVIEAATSHVGVEGTTGEAVAAPNPPIIKRDPAWMTFRVNDTISVDVQEWRIAQRAEKELLV